MRPNLGEERILKRGLERWRLLRLQGIEAQMLQLNEDFRAAQDGLGIIHLNPGVIAEDVTEHLWQELNRAAIRLEELEGKHQKLLEMDLPHLIVAFQRSRKEKTWPWEIERWELVLC